MTDTTYETYDTNGQPLTVVGELLAESSSRRGDDRTRWIEYRIFGLQHGGYAVEILGRTTVRGEVDRRRTHLTQDPSEVIELLHSYDEVEDRTYLTYTARRALTLAACKDAPLLEAWQALGRVVA